LAWDRGRSNPGVKKESKKKSTRRNRNKRQAGHNWTQRERNKHNTKQNHTSARGPLPPLCRTILLKVENRVKKKGGNPKKEEGSRPSIQVRGEEGWFPESPCPAGALIGQNQVGKFEKKKKKLGEKAFKTSKKKDSFHGRQSDEGGGGESRKKERLKKKKKLTTPSIKTGMKKKQGNQGPFKGVPNKKGWGGGTGRKGEERKHKEKGGRFG